MLLRGIGIEPKMEYLISKQNTEQGAMLLVKSASNKTEEMAGCLREHDAFLEAPGLIPSPHMVASNSLYSSSRESEVFFLPPWVPGTHVMHRKNIQAKCSCT